MGAICSTMFQPRRDDKNGVGSVQDTDLKGSMRSGSGSGEAQVQKVVSDVPKRGKKRAATTETGARRRTRRSKNWTHEETFKLIESRLQPSLNKRKPEWEAISVQIPGRTGKQCQQRWDTVVRPYKRIKRHYDDHGKDFGQVTEEEFRSMNVDCRHWRDNNWYNMIDEHHLRLASGRPSHGLKGASTSTGTILGENDALPSRLATPTSPVDQREPSSSAVRFLINPLEWKVVLPMFISYPVHVSDIVVASVLVFQSNLRYVNVKQGNNECNKVVDYSNECSVFGRTSLLNFT